jgi:predicted Fe-Mo cluster-binding NifX family protein
MKIVVSAQGENLDAPASAVFGRCPTYLFVDTETLAFEPVANPAMNQGGGAGIQAAQFVVNQGAQAVLTGNLGPNAFGVLNAAGVPGYLVGPGTVRQAVEAFQAGQLQPMAGANVAGHTGMGMAPGMGGRRGTGMGRGGGRGMGRRMQSAAPVQSQSEDVGNSELAELRETVSRLRQQLADTMAKMEELEKGA